MPRDLQGNVPRGGRNAERSASSSTSSLSSAIITACKGGPSRSLLAHVLCRCGEAPRNATSTWATSGWHGCGWTVVLTRRRQTTLDVARCTNTSETLLGICAGQLCLHATGGTTLQQDLDEDLETIPIDEDMEDAEDAGGDTSLYWACLEGHLEII